jgi:hypothetical protein
MVLLMVLHAADMETLRTQLERSTPSGNASTSGDNPSDGLVTPSDHLRLCEQAYPCVFASSTSDSVPGYHPIPYFSHIIARVAALRSFVGLGYATTASAPPLLTGQGDEAPVLLDAMTLHFSPVQLRSLLRTRHELRVGDHPALSTVEQSKADELSRLLQ